MIQQPAPRPKITRSRLRLVITLLVVLVGCTTAAGYLAHGLTGPAAGAVVSKQSGDDRQSQPAGNYTLSGDYLSFSYPNSFTASPDQQLSSGMLQQNKLLSTSGGSKSLVVTVTSLPSGQLDDDPSFYMRSLHPQTYQLTKQTIGDDQVVIASRQGSFEEVAFWPHAGKLATIALSGTTTNQADALATFNQIVQSVGWQ